MSGLRVSGCGCPLSARMSGHSENATARETFRLAGSW